MCGFEAMELHNQDLSLSFQGYQRVMFSKKKQVIQ